MRPGCFQRACSVNPAEVVSGPICTEDFTQWRSAEKTDCRSLRNARVAASTPRTPARDESGDDRDWGGPLWAFSPLSGGGAVAPGDTISPQWPDHRGGPRGGSAESVAIIGMREQARGGGGLSLIVRRGRELGAWWRHPLHQRSSRASAQGRVPATAQIRPSQQRTDARATAPRQLLRREAGVLCCAPARRPERASDAGTRRRSLPAAKWRSAPGARGMTVAAPDLHGERHFRIDGRISRDSGAWAGPIARGRR